MDSDPGRKARVRVVLSCIALWGVVMACGPTNGPTRARLTLCAVDVDQRSACALADFANQSVVTGDFRALNASQTIRVRAVDAGTSAPLASTAITFSVSGANARTTTVNTDANGIAALTYAGAATGTDTITATPPSGFALELSRPAVVHWLKPQTAIHPIIFLHGINEDANVLARHEEWTSIFEALDITYDPSTIETFCYDDDRAYADPTQPAHCPAPGYTPSCVGAQCVSQSSVDVNAVELAERVVDLHQRTGKPVTLMGYSMGTAISRTMLAGCLNTPSGQDSDGDGDTDRDVCNAARADVDDTFFLNGVQQGSWLMAVKSGLDAASLAGQGIPPSPISPFFSVLPALESGIFGTVKSKMGLDANSAAARDLTPLSANIVLHNLGQIPPTVQVYTFYGAIQLRLGVSELLYPASGTQPLPLGDLVLLAQDDMPAADPPWGGASICGSCDPLDASGFHASQGSGQFHAWALADRHDVNIADVVPGVGGSFTDALNSPVSHLNISQPTAQAPGSAVQVEDITHLAGSHTTDMANEIVEIMMQQDGIA